MKKRSQLEILMKILENSMKKTKPTELMRATNISNQPMHRYIERLKAKGLIEEIEMGEEELKRDGRTKVNYITTTKGMVVVNIFKGVTESVG